MNPDERKKLRAALEAIARIKWRGRRCPYCGCSQDDAKAAGFVAHLEACPVFIASRALGVWLPSGLGPRVTSSG